jgi:hypothetical protein
MPDDLYTTDALAWAEHQADLPQRLSRGERVSAAIDWRNIVEEVRDVGQSELRAVRSLLARAIEHWRDGAMASLLDAAARFAPSMRARLDIGMICRQARLAQLSRRLGGAAPLFLPAEDCAYTLDDLLAADDTIPDIDTLVRRLTTDSGDT